jgi:hypothetical protein
MSSGPPPPPPWPIAPSSPKRPSQWRTVAFGIALLAIGAVAVGAWFRPLPENKPASPPAPTYTSQQIADAKTAVCSAFDKVHHAVDVANTRSGGDDPTAVLAVATAARQALDVGSRYLLTKLAEEPATPAELASQVRKLAGTYQEATIDYLAEAGEAELGPLGNASDEATNTIDKLCK